MNKNFKQKSQILLEALLLAYSSTVQIWLDCLDCYPLNNVYYPYEN